MPRTHHYDYKLLFDNKTVGIIIVNQLGEIIEANDFVSDLFGYKTNELTNSSITIDHLVPKNLHYKHQSNRQAYNKNPHTRVMGLGLDLFAQRKDGSVFPVEVSLSPYEIDKQLYTIAFITDITVRKSSELKIKKQNLELKQIRQELQRLNLELEKKVEERTHTLQETLKELEQSRNELEEALKEEKELGELKSRFVSMASHEFRTPLSTILSSAVLIDKYIEAQQFTHCSRHIQRIRSSVEHLSSVLEDFLSIGKIEEGKIEVNIERFNIVEEIHTIVSEMEELFKPQQTIKILNTSPFIVKSDRHLFKIALSNIISNAIKFSDDNGKIEIFLEKHEDHFIIHIKDNGIGIPLSEQKRLFFRFFRASNASSIQGTGLGTYIAQKYVNTLGGEIEFESTPNVGTTFYIKLPL